MADKYEDIIEYIESLKTKHSHLEHLIMASIAHNGYIHFCYGYPCNYKLYMYKPKCDTHGLIIYLERHGYFKPLQFDHLSKIEYQTYIKRSTISEDDLNDLRDSALIGSFNEDNYELASYLASMYHKNDVYELLEHGRHTDNIAEFIEKLSNIYVDIEDDPEIIMVILKSNKPIADQSFFLYLLSHHIDNGQIKLEDIVTRREFVLNWSDF
jgi:hypothetical protein